MVRKADKCANCDEAATHETTSKATNKVKFCSAHLPNNGRGVGLQLIRTAPEETEDES